jgi:hypothetical protein
VGTTDGPARASVPMHMSLGDLPYKDTKLVLKKEWGARGPEYHDVNQGEHHMKGYSGHTHGEQVSVLHHVCCGLGMGEQG